MEIFYHWNYDPPVRNIGGGTGSVLPGEFMGDVPFEKLRAMGTGKHSLMFDETARKNPRDSRSAESKDEKLMRCVRFEIFSERIRETSPRSTVCAIVLGMTPRNAEQILPLLSGEHRRELEEYAREIAATPEERARQEHDILYSSGSVPIPEENLATIRKYFSTTED